MVYFGNLCYNNPTTDGVQGGRHSLRKGGDAMEVYQTLTLMISFGTLVVLILSFNKKK
ncbi:hypothetical protein UNSWDHB_503 [Dehalobacter sp. UNSWDHB]|nr:hypothetical protein UNSWDHB_503 [Dehalobacter sp. UNSWDHB]